MIKIIPNQNFKMQIIDNKNFMDKIIPNAIEFKAIPCYMLCFFKRIIKFNQNDRL